MQKKAAQPRGYLYLKLFVFFVVFLTVGITVLRAVALYQERSFLGESYTTLYSNGEEHYLVSYHSPQKYVIAKLLRPPSLSLQEPDLLALSRKVGVPVNGVVVDRKMKSSDEIFSLSNVIRMLFVPHEFTLQDINGVDALSYHRLSRGVVDDNFIETEIEYPIGEKELESFRDADIFNAASSVEVVNATEVAGLGSEFAQMLTNRGYNVISITNSSALFDKSFVVVNRESDLVSAESLIELFDSVRRDQSVSEVADLVVVLGKDAGK